MYGDGSQTRDFVYVDDIVRALIFISKKKETCGVYNIGYGEQNKLLDVIRQYEKIAGKRLDIEFKDPRSGDIQESMADVTRLKKTGFVAKGGVENGLKKYWRYAESEF